MVLADDNFASIAHAVEEGRTVYDNLKKAIVFTLPTNGGEAGTIVFAIVAGLTMPITPVQILWVNMVTAVTLSLAFALFLWETERGRGIEEARTIAVNMLVMGEIFYLFGTAAIDAAAWWRVIALALGIFLLVEFEKWLWRRSGMRGLLP